MSEAENVIHLPKRTALLEITVLCPAWSMTETRIREPSVRDYMNARGAKDDQERTLIFLGSMVLGDDGNPVGMEAILNAPLAALGQLSPHMNSLLTDSLEDNRPLT